MTPDVKKLAQEHARQVLGNEQYNENTEAAQALAEDFTAGWNAAVAALATTPAPLAELATITELAAGQATLNGAISGPYHVRPAGDYEGWVLVSDYDLAKHDEGQSLDFATFSDEGTANYAAAACNALPGLLARLAAAEAALKKAIDRLPAIAQELGDAEELADEGDGDGYEACYNAAGNARGAINGLLRELTPTVKGGQPNA